MSYSVKLSVEGRQQGEGNSPEMVTLSTETKAEAFFRAGSHFLLYEEEQEGFEETCRVRLKITPKLLEITRKGLIESRLILEIGEDHTVDYRTPYGVFYIGTTVKAFELTEEEGSLTLKIEYTLTESGQFMSDNVVTVIVTGLKDKLTQ